MYIIAWERARIATVTSAVGARGFFFFSQPFPPLQPWPPQVPGVWMNPDRSPLPRV